MEVLLRRGDGCVSETFLDDLKVGATSERPGDAGYLLSILRRSRSQHVSRIEAGKAREARGWPVEIQAGREPRLAIQQLWKKDSIAQNAAMRAPCLVGSGTPAGA
jgi:hypothetical protein